MELNDMARGAYETAVEKGFHPDEIVLTVGECRNMTLLAVRIALIHSEASEALEELRNTPFNLELFGAELADILIRVGDLATIVGVNLDEAVRVKMAYNKTRTHRHGGRAL